MTAVLEIQLFPGDILYREGDGNDCAYVIESGEVILYRGSSGERTDVERRGAGSIVGELSILTGQPRAVTVEALTQCTVYQISADRIQSRFEKIDPILRACIDTSINFTATFAKQTTNSSESVATAESTLRNSAELIEQFRLETDIAKGLENREFVMVFQPIVRLADGNIMGFEALMRWQHPKLGNVPPERFIEVAEATGSIKLLTEFAIMETCAAMQRFKALEGVSEQLYASVNVSGQDIGRKGFVEFLAFVLEANDIQPKYIKLEVTETALIPDLEAADRNFKHLQALGCGISIDDFGTGYSNLAYLKSLPITSLKIDRAFTEDARTNSVSRSIVRLLVLLGKDLGVDIIAEGMETKHGVEIIHDLGCSYAQGFYFYKPMREAEFALSLAGAQPDRGVA
ncbi:EAL domain-containing protein [uncultured Roseobacter sp.]|uniref:EAL domain-containing protein n=1 Tax=uncultured Roseobacter sp. TaxID=114847 RepID=UPI00260F47C5|nr:EAL domain-containing protein [uncultured Roseobacter sp.]